MWYFPKKDMRVEVQAVENWQERVMILPEPPAVDVDELTVPQKGSSMRMFSALEIMSSHTHGLPCSLPDASMVSGLQSTLLDKRHPHTGNHPLLVNVASPGAIFSLGCKPKVSAHSTAGFCSAIFHPTFSNCFLLLHTSHLSTVFAFVTWFCTLLQMYVCFTIWTSD